jgi:hypothetical protein
MAIQITVKGPKGSGKELVAQLLAVQLAQSGFVVRLRNGKAQWSDKPQLVRRVKEVAKNDERIRVVTEETSPDWSIGDEIGAERAERQSKTKTKAKKRKRS